VPDLFEPTTFQRHWKEAARSFHTLCNLIATNNDRDEKESQIKDAADLIRQINTVLAVIEHEHYQRSKAYSVQ
jgi:hypothetical protein